MWCFFQFPAHAVRSLVTKLTDLSWLPLLRLGNFKHIKVGWHQLSWFLSGEKMGARCLSVGPYVRHPRLYLATYLHSRQAFLLGSRLDSIIEMLWKRKDTQQFSTCHFNCKITSWTGNCNISEHVPLAFCVRQCKCELQQSDIRLSNVLGEFLEIIHFYANIVTQTVCILLRPITFRIWINIRLNQMKIGINPT